MIYLASPFSSGLPTIVEERYSKTVQFTLQAIANGYPLFSPIVYFKPLASALKLPDDAGFWHNMNMEFLRKAEMIWVLRLPGWDQSKGMQVELRVAKMLNMPRTDFGPDFNQIQ